MLSPARLGFCLNFKACLARFCHWHLVLSVPRCAQSLLRLYLRVPCIFRLATCCCPLRRSRRNVLHVAEVLGFFAKVVLQAAVWFGQPMLLVHGLTGALPIVVAAYSSSLRWNYLSLASRTLARARWCKCSRQASSMRI